MSTTESSLQNNFDPVNVLVAALGFTTSFAIGIAFTPYLVGKLGVTLYGYIPLALAFVGYFSFLTQALSIALNRKLTEFFDHPVRYSEFATLALTLCGFLTACFSIVFVPVLIGLELVFNIPEEAITSVKWLFFATMWSMSLSVLLTPYNSVLFSCHRHYVMSLMTSSQNIVRVLLIVVLFTVFRADLENVSLALGASATLGFVLTIACAYYFQPNLTLRSSGRWRSDVKDLLDTGGGVLITQIGTVIVFSIDLLAVNYFYGAEETGHYAASAQWAYAARSLAIVIAAVFSSRILALYFDREIEALVQYTSQRMRFLGVVLALPVGFLCATSPTLLELWLGEEFRSNWPIMVALLAPIALNGSQIPLLSISVAANKVYVPGLVTLASAVLLISVIWVIGTTEGLGPEWIAVAVSAVLVAKYVLFSTWFAAQNINRNLLVFYKPVLMTLLWLVYAFALGFWLCNLIAPASFLQYLAVGAMASLLYFVGVAFTLPRQDLLEFASGLGRLRYSMTNGRT